MNEFTTRFSAMREVFALNTNKRRHLDDVDDRTLILKGREKIISFLVDILMVHLITHEIYRVYY